MASKSWRIRWGLMWASLFAAVTASAHPVEFDVDGAHVIVLRPLDSWSGDEALLNDSLKSVKDKRATYSYFTDEGQYLRGCPTVFQSVSNHPITRGAEVALKEIGFKLANNDDYRVTFERSVMLTGENYKHLVAFQSELFRNVVLEQGDPATLQSRVSARKAVGAVLAVATTALMMDKMGWTTGSQVSMGTNLPADIVRLTVNAKGAIAPLPLPAADLSADAQVEIHRLTGRSATFGQVVIQYSHPKTAEIQQAAMLKAIVVALGADTDADAVEKARAEDYAARLAIWAKCQSESSCTPWQPIHHKDQPSESENSAN